MKFWHLFAAWLALCSAAWAQPLQVVTEDFPPYQFERDGKLGGMAVDVARELLKEAGLNAEIKLYPWARAYQLAQGEPNVLIFSIARTPQREALFKWIGTITPYRVYLWRLAERPELQVHNLDEAKRFMVGGVYQDVKPEHLKTQGFREGTNLELAPSDDINIRKLFARRIDLLPFDEINFIYKLSLLSHKPSEVTRVLLLDGISNDLYIAASLGTPDETVQRLRDALATLKRSGRYEQIKAAYLR